MDLNIYQVILGPVISDKAYKLNQKLKKLALKVHPKANKKMIIEALEKLFNVKVRDVRTITRKGKNKRVKRKVTTGPTTKKAIVTLAEGYTLDLLGQGSGYTPEESAKVAK